MALPMFNSMTMDAPLKQVCPSKNANKPRPEIILAYLGFAAIATVVYHQIAEGEFSSVLTLSAIFQCLAFTLLGLQVLSTSSAQGISAKSLALDAFAIACRLTSTTWLEGYLPNDSTGDFLYQAFDVMSLCMVIWLLYRVLKVEGQSYDQSADAWPAASFAVGSLVLAFFLHGDLDDRPLFDALWMCGLFTSAISVLPQLYMFTRGHSNVAALTSHFVAVMAFSRFLSGSYMYHAHTEITCEPLFGLGGFSGEPRPGDFNYTGWAIMAAHALHLMLLGDFAYFYVKNVVTSGLQAPLDLADGTWVV